MPTKEGTAIEWTHVPGYRGETWNCMTGCDRVSPGCAHCYALELAGRLKGMGQKRYQRDGDPKTSGPGFGFTLHPDKLDQPMRWTAPRAIFVNSMSDVFHEDAPDDFIARMFAAMAAAPQHIFMVLTKRPERMRDWFAWEGDGINRCGTVRNEFDWHFADRVKDPMMRLFDWPLPNVWMGVTIENRRFVDRADLLRETPAAVRFISAEPLLGPLVPDGEPFPTGSSVVEGERVVHGMVAWSDGRDPRVVPGLDLTGIDWLITGGESGPRHRHFDPRWALDLRVAAQREGVAFFHKQNGGRTPKAGGRELGEGQTYSEFPPLPTAAL